jgi:hypothetical protein
MTPRGAVSSVPGIAWQLGLLGLVPLIWGVAELYLPLLRSVAENWMNPWFHAPFATLRYAEIILMFNSGVLWGFAAKTAGPLALGAYNLSILPALYAFLFVIGETQEVALKLAIGFAGLLALDAVFHRQSLTPDWWMRLRVPLCAAAILCLMAIWFAPADLVSSSR